MFIFVLQILQNMAWYQSAKNMSAFDLYGQVHSGETLEPTKDLHTSQARRSVFVNKFGDVVCGEYEFFR